MAANGIRTFIASGGVLIALTLTWTPAWADGGNVVVSPGDFGGQYEPPNINMTATSPGSTGASGHANPGAGFSGSQGTSGNAGGSGGQAAPACTYTPTGISPQQLETQFADYQAGPSAGSGSVGYNVTCNGMQIGWVLGDPGGPGGGHGPGPVLPSPGELAGQAYAQMQLPLPVPHHSPDVHLPDGRQATIVDEHTWMWTDHSMWAPRRKRIQTGPVWAEVTATPMQLTVDSTLGAAVTCTGPGTPYTRASGLHAASPDCGLVFPRSSYGLSGDETTVTYAVRWHVTWIGSTGSDSQGGTLPDLTSRAAENIAVVEIQALRSH